MRYENNPLNIRYNSRNNWIGSISPVNGFCRFRSLRFGLRASIKILLRYRTYGVVSIKSIIARWAPPSDNNPTDAYIKFVVAWMNANRSAFYDTFVHDLIDETFCEDSSITDGTEVAILLCAMASFEQGNSMLDMASDAILACKEYYPNYENKNYEF